MRIQSLCIGICLMLTVSAWPAAGQAIIDPLLQEKLGSGGGPYQVIVTFKEHSNIQQLASLGAPYLSLTVLPMAGAILTAEQVAEVRSWESVESIYSNSQLSYFNHDAGEMTGAHYVQSTLGIAGRDQTIVVLDSGIDATHPDLAFGTKVIQNVKILGDLGLTGATAFLEGVINTDNTSGHGTHVSGTVGGTGAASANDERDPYYYRGVAPGSKIVGLGAGETLLILHALVGFDYAIANRDRFSVDVITNSWGNTSSQYDPNNPISRASYEAYRRGIVVTFAAGNEGPGDNSMSTYSISPWVIGVAAGSKTRELADFSSRGEAGDPFEHPDLTAPGVNITSTRAAGTPVGALGPVVNPNHPEYYFSYHTISGTSMATPFIAGTVALLLEANPELSPDQIEDILVSTADPMPAYAFHQVGSGYVNVRRAVELALTTVGNRTAFLAGDTRWSSQGTWTVNEQSSPNVAYFGKWKTVSNSSASGGSYTVGTSANKGGKAVRQPYMKLTFFGTAVKIGHPKNPNGGTAEVLIDGVSRGVVGFYDSQESWGNNAAYGGLENSYHTLELRGLTGNVYVDQIFVDGELYPAATTFVEETETYNGSLGPSVEGIPETRLIPFQISDETIQLTAELSWTGGVDVDLYLLDPSGATVASSASLANPEAFSYWVTAPGTYTYKIVGYATVLANYTLTSTQTRALMTAQGSTGRLAQDLSSEGSAKAYRFALNQNYPNPFNPETNIFFTLASEGMVSLKVYNLLGREVATLAQERRSAGPHTVRFDARHLPTGVYFLKLHVMSDTEQFTKVNRMILLR